MCSPELGVSRADSLACLDAVLVALPRVGGVESLSGLGRPCDDLPLLRLDPVT